MFVAIIITIAFIALTWWAWKLSKDPRATKSGKIAFGFAKYLFLLASILMVIVSFSVAFAPADKSSSSAKTSKSSSSAVSKKTTNSTLKTKSNLKISGSATEAINYLTKKLPGSADYIKSIDQNSEYGLKITTRGLSLSSKKNQAKTESVIHSTLLYLQDLTDFNGAGFTQKEKSDDTTLYAAYYAKNAVKKALSSTDIFNAATSFYIDSSQVTDNDNLAGKTLNKIGPEKNGKSYVNMIMND